MPTVIGLDLSLTATGIAGNTTGTHPTPWATVLKPPPRLRGHERLHHLATAITARTTHADIVIVEGPSYGSQAGQSGHHERAGLWWHITHQLWQAGTPIAVVPPACLKRYATGKGNASKDLVLTEVARRFAWCPGDNNAADAAALAAMGADHYGHALAVMPAANRKGLDAVDWPALLIPAGAAP